MTKENGMYRLQLPDGSLSILYNETRAIEFLRRMEKGNGWEEIRIGYEPVN